MSFLQQIEMSFQDAENFLQASSNVLGQKSKAGELNETITHIRSAKQYVSKLRQEFPAGLSAQEDAIIEALRKTRSNRTFR